MTRPLEFATLEEPFATLEERLSRIEKAISTLAWWLTQTPDSLGQQDARGIDRILRGEEPLSEPGSSAAVAGSPESLRTVGERQGRQPGSLNTRCDYRFDPESRCDGCYDEDGRCDQCGKPSIFEDYDPE